MEKVFIKFFCDMGDDLHDIMLDENKANSKILNNFLKPKNLEAVVTMCDGFEYFSKRNDFVEISSTYNFSKQEKIELVKILKNFVGYGDIESEDNEIMLNNKSSLKNAIFYQIDDIMEV